MKYNQELPEEVESKLDAYIERVKNIKWFRPEKDLSTDTLDILAKASIDAFGIKATVEYRKLKTTSDWGAARDAAWGAARDAAWGAAWYAAWGAARDAAWGAARDAAWDAAWGAYELLVSDLKEYKGKFAFLSLVDLYDKGVYPIGVVDGKFIIYIPE